MESSQAAQLRDTTRGEMWKNITAENKIFLFTIFTCALGKGIADNNSRRARA